MISKDRKPKTFMLDSKSSFIVVFAITFILNVQDYTYLKPKYIIIAKEKLKRNHTQVEEIKIIITFITHIYF